MIAPGQLSRRLPSVAFAAFGFLAVATLVGAGTITVDSTSGLTGGGDCSLRDAITAANENTAVAGCTGATAGPDTIEFAPALAGATIRFFVADNYWYGPNALPPIYSEITIDGGEGGITLERSSSGQRMRFFYVAGELHPVPVGPKTSAPSPGTLTLRRLTLRNGLAHGGDTSDSGGGGSGMGGAIYNQGTVLLDQVLATGNRAHGGNVLPALTGGSGPGGSGGGGGMGGNGTGGGGGFRPTEAGDGAGDGGDFLDTEGGAAFNSCERSVVVRDPCGEGGVSTIGGDGTNGGLDNGPSGDGGGFRQGTDGGGAGSNTNVGGGGGGAFGGGGGSGVDNFNPPNVAGGSGGVGGGGGPGFPAGGNGGFGGGGGRGTEGNGGFGGGGGARPFGGVGGFGGGGGARALGGAFGGDGGSRTSSGSIDQFLGDKGGGGGAGFGGVLFNHFGEATVLNSTLTGNAAEGGDGGGRPTDTTTQGGGGGAGLGGAIFNLNGEVTIRLSTLAANRASGGVGGPFSGEAGEGQGGAVFNHFQDTGVGNDILSKVPTNTIIKIEHAILADSILQDGSVANSDGVDCYNNNATIDLTAFNLIEAQHNCDTPDTSALITNDPMLAPLSDNGGPTQTMALLPDSPAIDRALSTCPEPRIDQRGSVRPVDGNSSLAPRCDLGAFEFGVEYSIDDVSALEGNGPGTMDFAFTITRFGDTFNAGAVTATTQDDSATTADNDYQSTSQSVAFAAGQETATFNVPVMGDLAVELDEEFLVNLSAPTDVGALIDDGLGVGTILNDDAEFSGEFSVSDVTAVEGDGPGTSDFVFVITRTGNTEVPSSVVATTQDDTATEADNDYQPTMQTVSFAPNQVMADFIVPVVGDQIVEPDEVFFVNLGSPGGSATIDDGQGVGTILNDDTEFSGEFSVSDVTAVESDGPGTSEFVFVITRTGNTEVPSTVVATTEDDTATEADNDYQFTTQVVSFAPDQVMAEFIVPVIGDQEVETDETFLVNLSSPGGSGTIGNGQGVGSILNDDLEQVAIPTLSHAGVLLLALLISGAAVYRMRA